MPCGEDTTWAVLVLSRGDPWGDPSVPGLIGLRGQRAQCHQVPPSHSCSDAIRYLRSCSRP